MAEVEDWDYDDEPVEPESTGARTAVLAVTLLIVLGIVAFLMREHQAEQRVEKTLPDDYFVRQPVHFAGPGQPNGNPGDLWTNRDTGVIYWMDDTRRWIVAGRVLDR